MRAPARCCAAATNECRTVDAQPARAPLRRPGAGAAARSSPAPCTATRPRARAASSACWPRSSAARSRSCAASSPSCRCATRWPMRTASAWATATSTAACSPPPRRRTTRTASPTCCARCWPRTRCCSTCTASAAPGQPFVMRGPADNRGELEPFAHAEAEARLAAHAGPSRVVDGWMDAYAAGVARRRARGLTPGRGRRGPELRRRHHRVHAQPGRLRHHARMRPARRPGGARRGAPRHPPDAGSAGPRRAAAGAAGGALRVPGLAEVVDRHAEGDRFVKTWTSFDPLAEGELIALRADGSEVRAPQRRLHRLPRPRRAAGARVVLPGAGQRAAAVACVDFP